MKSQPSPRRLALVTAALAAMPVLFAAKVEAQQQVGTNGTALDANNRIGSNGYNTYRPAPTAGVLGNQVINGNVSNGRGFHGYVPYSDPNEFGGFQAGQAVSNFEKNSVGVGVPYSATSVPNISTPYYAENRFAPPAAPGKYTTTPNSPGYVPAQPIVVQANDNRLGARLDAVGVAGSLPKPGELVLPGPVDPASNTRTIFTASALTGVRPWNTSDASTLQYLAQFTGMKPDNVLDRLNMNQNDLLRMRQELGTASGVNSKGPLNASGKPTNADPNAPLDASVTDPLGAPTDPLMKNAPTDAALASNALGGNLSTSETLYNKVLGEPDKQSKTYDELKKRLSQFKELQKDPAQASADAYNKAKREQAAAAAAANQVGLTPKVGDGPNKDAGAAKAPVAKIAPVSVKSMTEGVQAAGLKDMLGKAETLMKTGKFTSAIDTYAAAEQVAPNQPLIWVGRANAELGAAYYGRAEAHLKQAFTSDKALLMGQYDLRSFLGEDRLTAVVKDLQEIARSDTQSATPVFLLAYLSYNTGNESRAAAYLDLADKRSGGKDAVIKLMRDHWSLPTGGTVPDVNK